MAKSKEVKAIDIASDLINNTKKYELVYSDSNTSKKTLKSKLMDMYNDCQIMLKDIKEFEPEIKSDIDKHLNALKNLSENSSVNETRVRFWINLMQPIMLQIAKRINEQNNGK